jgi:type III secretory pathway component EscU
MDLDHQQVWLPRSESQLKKIKSLRRKMQKLYQDDEHRPDFKESMKIPRTAAAVCIYIRMDRGTVSRLQ